MLLAPTVLSFIWFSAFGTLSTSLQDSGVNLIRFATEEILFASFNEYPLGSVLSLLAIILVLTFFVTSADSATYVLAMLSEDGNLNPSNRKKVIWGVMLALIAIALMFSGGLTALQNTLHYCRFSIFYSTSVDDVVAYERVISRKRANGTRHYTRPIS